MSLGERLLKYAEAIVTLRRSLEATEEHIRAIRAGAASNRERIIRLEAIVEGFPLPPGEGQGEGIGTSAQQLEG